MLMYPLAEASELLSGKLSSAKKSLADAVEDLEWIREQVTVMEVNFARVHNVSTRTSAGGCAAASRARECVWAGAAQPRPAPPRHLAPGRFAR